MAQVCRESRYLLHPVKPETDSLKTMTQQRESIIKKGLTWGWDCWGGWDWFNADLDSIFLPETVLWLNMGLEALDVLDRIVGPVKHVLVPWDPEEHGRVLSQTNYPAALINLPELETVGFVMATRRLKRCAHARWPVLPYALDIDNEDDVKDVLAILGDKAEFFRLHIHYYRSYGVNDPSVVQFWDLSKQSLQREWMVELKCWDSVGLDDDMEDKEYVANSLTPEWVHENIGRCSEFQRIIMLE
ncbi:hypothetical protein PG996_009966 [Apiospora saccharicola]|uniref:Uncharacterized protein n=1 Tax=Apiospora saccharicola TaxID=335842 RepID=A0ABR1UPR5_9PEZI